MKSVSDICRDFETLKREGRFVPGRDRDGSGDTLEILNAQFLATLPTIYGKPSHDYVRRELDWYLSESRNVNDIEAPIPEIWKRVAADDGTINSNYGWCVFSEENGHQFAKCRDELIRDWSSRRAVMIYNRPTMHEDAFEGGRADFMCTNVAQCFIRREPVRGLSSSNYPYCPHLGRYRPVLHYSVFMRSNDAVFGYKNDLAWHEFVRDELLAQLIDLRADDARWLVPSTIAWHAASLHVYRRHWDLIP